MICTILFGHGSADKPWVAEFEEIRDFVADRVMPDSSVRTAFLQFIRPTLRDAAAAAIAEGTDRLVIVPVFLFSGRHVREDVPTEVARVRHLFPDIEVTVTDTLGSDRALAVLVADRVKDSLPRPGPIGSRRLQS